MFDAFNTDKYTRLRYDNTTGGQNRQWVRYADGMFEPVRKEGDLMKKRRTDDPADDWWVTEKPRDWDPRDHGIGVTLNRVLGGAGTKAARPGVALSTVPWPEEAAPFATANATRPADTQGLGHPGDSGQRRTAPARPLGSLLAQGSQGLMAFEGSTPAAAQAPQRNAIQDAEALKQWEKGQKPGPDAQRESESWAYKYLLPDIYKPNGHPDKERARKQIKTVMKAKLQPFADGFLGLPDPIVTPFKVLGTEYRKMKK